MRPRNLRVLRIDDDALVDGLESDVPRATPPVPWIDLYGASESSEYASIRGWLSSMAFWRAFRGSDPPDLVVTDVLFENDDSTPLSLCPTPPSKHLSENYLDENLQEKRNPTGLLHLIPFVAMSRALCMPLGFAVHTKNPRLWRTLVERHHPMGLLAAHLIGELSALFGEGIDGATRDERIESCWVWLRAFASDDYPRAVRVALRDYRRRFLLASCSEGGLPNLVVLPGHWAELAAWAYDMARHPREMSSDVGVSVVYRDGRRDCLRLLSLFADAMGISTNVYPESCFVAETVESDSEPWELDSFGQPQFGAFIQRLSMLTVAYEDACRLLERHFPPDPLEQVCPTSNVVDIAEGVGSSRFVVGLAVVLQCVVWEHVKLAAWQNGMMTSGWNPEARRLDRDGDLQLAAVLRRLWHLISMERGDDEFGVDDVLDDREWPRDQLFDFQCVNADWVIWHFERLIAAGLLQNVRGREYRCFRQVRSGDQLDLDLIPPPENVPEGFDYPKRDRNKVLAASLGLGEVHGVGRAIGRAFCGTGDDGMLATEGRRFLARLREGEGPSWLLEICRIYAVNVLHWKSSQALPHWLRSSVVETW